MIFKIHYFLESSGICAIVVLLGVFVREYTDASELEIGALFLVMPVSALLARPILCALADQKMQHKKYLIIYLWIFVAGYLPFIIIPFLGPAVYQQHPRVCWYTLLVFKVIGSIGLGSVAPIADSLAINYAERINDDYAGYRTWGTISWGVFGIIIGQMNEVWFLPRFVPAFIVLLVSALLEIFLFWLWPDEFFVIVPRKELENIKLRPKQIMTNKQVFQAMKQKLLNSLCVNCDNAAEKTRTDFVNSKPQQVVVVVKPNNNNNDLKLVEESQKQPQTKQAMHNSQDVVDRHTQFIILARLMRRDPRIVLYLLLITFGGFLNGQLSFFFVYLSKWCNTDCNFSHLAGYLQSLPAIVELFFFTFLTPLKNAIGRVNLFALSFAYNAMRFLFYAFSLEQVSPYYSIFSELLQGCSWGVNVALCTELAHEFSNEVDKVLPELIESDTISKNADTKKLLLVLSSTMQALMSGAMDGVGVALSALIGGYMADRYSFHALWLLTGTSSAVITMVLIACNIFCGHYKPLIARKQVASKC